MPLLKKKTLEKVSMPEDLRDDEEVFLCKMTNEIFRDYEEFAERTILCNSMVWTCSLTGKSNLTYLEALQSEENAKRNLRGFPVHLRVPVLYLANRTRRSSFTEMTEDVFCYVKDRYFVSENIEACFSGNKWRNYCVLQVIGPAENNAKKITSVMNGTTDRQFSPHPSLYRYDLEQLETEDDDVIEKMMVDYTQIRRKKGTYTREKNKLFLKQYVEQNDEGRYKIKESALKSFGIHRVKFDEIFDRHLPDFTASKRVQNNVVNGKKTRQETLAKYLIKNNIASPESGKRSLIDEIKKKQKGYQHEKELKQKKEELKQQKKQEFSKITQLYNKWCKPKDDLELEDQKKLPTLHRVKIKVSDEYVGDMLMILEFVNTFSSTLRKKDFFPGGLTLDLMERALTENEISGPLIDLIQMLLSSLFALQEEESTQRKIKYLHVKVPTERSEKPSLSDCALYATAAIRWPRRHHGLPLGKLPMYSLTISEILRLHLLSSGARIQEGGAKWRYQHRGGYVNEDDPGLCMRWQQPHLIQALSIHSIVQFTIGDKLKIISCLIDQLLTYADVRDVIEDRLETSKSHRTELKSAQFSEKKRYAEFILARNKYKSEGNSAELEKLKKENEQHLAAYTKKISKLSTLCLDHQILLGFDRAFRRYLKLESVPGLFVDSCDTNAGSCLNKIVHQNSQLIDAEKKVLMDYIKKTYNEMNTSDKENDPNKLPKLNGINSSLDEEIKNCEENLMCSADPKTCPIHSDKKLGHIEFFSNTEQLKELINSLNKRGIREGELQQNLKNLSESLSKLILITPSTELNPAIAEDANLRITRKGKSKYENANLGFPTTTDITHILHTAFTDNILEMEEKIFSGCLGVIKVKDRNKWRECLSSGTYSSFDRTITRSVENKNVEEESKGSRESTPDNARSNTYIDPGSTLYLDTSIVELEHTNITLSENQKLAVECLAIALTQIAYSVNSKYLQNPLGHAGMKEEAIRNCAIPCDVLKDWELSLLSSTSYSQLFLHYETLDTCIMWSRSALLARCRICGRQADSENMLLCDNCNRGQHLYCHRPILRSIPQGKWFCFKCSREKENETKQLSPKPEKKIRRRIFTDEDIDEEEEETLTDAVEKEPECVSKGSDEEVDLEESDKDDMEESKPEKCTLCDCEGDLLVCEKCSKHYHIECLQPPLRRKPRGQWCCNDCKNRKNIDETHLKVQRTGMHLNQRRCATRARHKIHGFIKSLRGTSFSEDSISSSFSRRVGRREADDLPLHNAALHDLLNDVMKDVDAWPFIRPVQKNEVPDYYEVITKPMDFGTIKYKLNMGKYTCDEEFMADAVLIFQNCNTYNDTDAEVYKCGVRLLRLFEKRSKNLGLKLPEEMQDDNIESNWQPKNKKRRVK